MFGGEQKHCTCPGMRRTQCAHFSGCVCGAEVQYRPHTDLCTLLADAQNTFTLDFTAHCLLMATVHGDCTMLEVSCRNSAVPHDSLELGKP